MKNAPFLYVKTIAEEKSFSKASKRLGISQPALSSYITKLEKQLQVPLFDRSISPIQLTEIGQYYLDYANTVMSAQEQFQNIVSDLTDLSLGKIVLGSTSFFSACYLPRPTSSFLSKYPGVTLHILEAKISEIEEKCLNGEVDLFLADANLNYNLFETQPLFDERVLILIPPDSPIHNRLTPFQIPVEAVIEGRVSDSCFLDLDLKLLQKERFLLLNEEQHIRRIADALFEQSCFKPMEAMQVSQMMTSYMLTMAGIGISFITESTLKYSTLPKPAVCYRLNAAYSTRTIAVAYKKNRYLPKACKLYIEELRRCFS